MRWRTLLHPAALPRRYNLPGSPIYMDAQILEAAYSRYR
jgi:hypothetical protein